MRNLVISAGFVCLVCCAGYATAQTAATSNDPLAEKKTVGLFYNSFGNYAGLYNGSEYIMYDPRVKGTPYFLAADMQPGDVLYNGALYTGVPLLYEITTGRVVTRQFGQGVLMNLINEKISSFTLMGHYFISLTADSTNKTISSGFYDRIYNGSFVLYAKRQKIVYEEPNTFERSFVEKDQYYIFRNNTYYEVNDRGSFLALFKERRKDLVKYLRQNDIKFKDEPEIAMVKLAAYYDTLTH